MSGSGLPSPPLDDNKSATARKMSKASKPLNRSSKRSNTAHEHSSVVLDGRHKRVWKACERCRMKKTKCDGESPCKRCKDDGLVCTAGSRRKTEFKQLPRGYAEVLENTQYALIATVQKLYTMLRNGDSWDLGEPELNERGQPVIHDIASRLGCIRASPDLPYAFPEGEQDFAELQAQLQSARSEQVTEGSEDQGQGRKLSEDCSVYSPSLQRTERASSSESDHSNLSKDYHQMIWAQRQAAAAKLAPRKPARLSIACDERQPYPCSLNTPCARPSPIYTDIKTESPMLRTASPFSPWSGTDDFLSPAHALDPTTQYMRQQQQQFQIPCSSPAVPRPRAFETDSFKVMHMNDGLNFADGTIRPGMLDCRSGYDMDMQDQMDNIIYNGEY
ncbi:c6 zinc finger domain containing protein [Diplocarpon rosae]|nr:c6 zinc finger domain containing protein [Diplocarpon rosae]